MGTTLARLVLMTLGMVAGLAAGEALVLPIYATAGVAIAAAGVLGMIPRRRRRDRAAAATAPQQPATTAAPPPPADPEMLMPRWRRPSLQAARRSDGRTSTARPPMTFDVRRSTYESWEDETELPEDATLMRIRGALVPLLHMPDEVLGDPIADLIRGDEVAVLAEQGTYRFVACPDGRRGWVHRTSLVGELSPDEERDPDVVPTRNLVATSR